MGFLDAVTLFLAGVLSGAVNAVAGGGTFLTFGALTLTGSLPITANATSSVAQFPGYITSTLAYWSDIRHMWRGALLLCLISAAGALAGALILLSLSNPSFRALVPWLLISATALFATGPWLKPKPKPGAVILCGRFEGVDQRVIEARGLEEVSIGDFILSGGEPAALVLLDAVVRLLPGVMGNERSGEEESFENGLLEHPHYTRPQEFEGRPIPEVLVSGNHARIAAWRREQAERLTAERRPDLLSPDQPRTK